MTWADFAAEMEILTSTPERARLLLDYAEEAMQTSPDRLEPLLITLSSQCRSENLHSMAGRCDRVLGWMAFDRSEFSEALGLFEQAEETFVASSDPEGQILALNGIASVHMAQGRYDAALSGFRHALSVSESLHSDGQTLVLKANIGEALNGLHQFGQAREILGEVLASGKLSALNECMVSTQMGRACLPLFRRDEAEVALNRAIELGRQGNYLPTLALALDLLGSLRVSRGDLDAAEGPLHESLEVAQKVGDRATAVQAQIDQGWLALARHDAAKAQTRFDQAWEDAQSIGAKGLEAEALSGRARVAEAQERWKDAFEALRGYNHLSQKLHDEDVTRQLAFFKSDEAQREAAAARRQSQILARLGDLGQKITARLDLEAIVLAVYESIGQLMMAETFGLGLYLEDEAKIEYRLLIENNERIAPFQVAVSAETLSGWCLRNRKEIVMGDIDLEYGNYLPVVPPRFGSNPLRARSCIYTPLMAEGRVLGLITAQSYQQKAYGDQDVATMKTLAASIAIAVRNAQLFEQVHLLATVDALTGASTRRYLFERADEEFERFRRTHNPVSLIMIDIDHFKILNDTWGHQVGDRVLSEFGQLIANQKRPHDLFGRYGGEEFAVVLVESDLLGAQKTAERLCRLVSETTIRTNEGEVIPLSASFGVTAFHPSDEKLSRIFGRADEALYEAKRSGRGRVVVRLP